MSLPGHNSVAAEQLLSYLTRIERLEEEVDGLNEDKREIYSEAKAAGFCKKTMRKVILRRRKTRDDVQEEDETLALYEAVLAQAHQGNSGSQEEPDPLD